ncbi:MAG TPA: MscL family protein [Phycisphaerae bacterium]|nr:MscL family protein [Phycisphaerae bacterium]
MERLRKVWQEFKGFAFKGNVIDLAVAVVIGTAFNNVVNALVKNVIMPLISYVGPVTESYRGWKIGRIEAGLFIGEIVNFLLIAAALFFVIAKLIKSILLRAGPAPAPGQPTSKECPFCLSAIHVNARKCPMCTADLAPGKPPAPSPA